MAVYKVLQDIEADDKFIGPLTVRQFIYAGVAALSAYLSLLGLSKNIWLIPIVLMPFFVVSAFLAWPWSRDQPTEIWVLARIRFMLKSRKRIWDQAGLKQLVTITAPKRIEKAYTNGLSQIEVKSRLRALADTIDSRGWAVKNVNVNLFAQPSLITANDTEDRLIDPSSIPQEVPTFDVVAADDILDEQNNHVAQQLDQMIHASSKAHRDQLVQQVRDAAQHPDQAGGPPNDYWFMNNAPQNVPGGYATFSTQVVAPGSTSAGNTPTKTADDQALLNKIHHQQVSPTPGYGHLKTIQPLSAHQSGGSDASKSVVPPMTPPKDPAILGLAQRDDLNVATIARQANAAQAKDKPDDEVVISLH